MAAVVRSLPPLLSMDAGVTALRLFTKHSSFARRDCRAKPHSLTDSLRELRQAHYWRVWRQGLGRSHSSRAANELLIIHNPHTQTTSHHSHSRPLFPVTATITPHMRHHSIARRVSCKAPHWLVCVRQLDLGGDTNTQPRRLCNPKHSLESKQESP